ncbi:hypothetical protein Hypma_001967 [Hypsizygus marmoreus]|uniref:Uncharacterized protein n=1 Tax=Hypsizygus marmoreus TaxID=39966 RepID=A0A369J8B9_HYPMA|nr:hypothetical protein Hypma_001967 [Hypsizygus marmoreus]
MEPSLYANLQPASRYQFYRWAPISGAWTARVQPYVERVHQVLNFREQPLTTLTPYHRLPLWWSIQCLIQKRSDFPPVEMIPRYRAFRKKNDKRRNSEPDTQQQSDDAAMSELKESLTKEISDLGQEITRLKNERSQLFLDIHDLMLSKSQSQDINVPLPPLPPQRNSLQKAKKDLHGRQERNPRFIDNQHPQPDHGLPFGPSPELQPQSSVQSPEPPTTSDTAWQTWQPEPYYQPTPISPVNALSSLGSDFFFHGLFGPPSPIDDDLAFCLLPSVPPAPSSTRNPPPPSRSLFVAPEPQGRKPKIPALQIPDQVSIAPALGLFGPRSPRDEHTGNTKKPPPPPQPTPPSQSSIREKKQRPTLRMHIPGSSSPGLFGPRSPPDVTTTDNRATTTITAPLAPVKPPPRLSGAKSAVDLRARSATPFKQLDAAKGNGGGKTAWRARVEEVEDESIKSTRGTGPWAIAILG